MIPLHQTGGLPEPPTINPFTIVLAVLLVATALFYAGVLPIPVGYDRGKVRFLIWCGTGMHVHSVYYHKDNGFKSIHPKDKSE